jgi:SAM-dependent methyltransferase
MTLFSTRKSVDEYIQMADGYDGIEIVKVLNRYLGAGSSVLEIGMGPGKDLIFLQENYKVTGSDNSQAFLDFYLENNEGADVFKMDAIEMNTDRKFDCIYSNKVIHFFEPDEIRRSFINQSKVLNSCGLICHTLWYGDKQIEVKGMKFYYYTKETILQYLPQEFDLIHAEVCKEMDDEDSLLIICKLKC